MFSYEIVTSSKFRIFKNVESIQEHDPLPWTQNNSKHKKLNKNTKHDPRGRVDSIYKPKKSYKRVLK